MNEQQPTNDETPIDREADTIIGPKELLFASEPWRASVEAGFDVTIDTFHSTAEPGASGFYSVMEDLRGRRVVCLPFCDYYDPGFTTEAGWQDYTDHLRGLGGPITIRPFDNRLASADASFEHRHELCWHGIDLREGAEAVLAAMPSKRRYPINRAGRRGYVFRSSNSIEDLRVFHRMHVELRKRKYRLLAQPLRFFEELLDNFGDRMSIFTAELDGEAVATMIYFDWDGVWYYKFSASIDNSAPNAALLMEALREGEKRGLHTADLGRSDLDQPGLLVFKEQFLPQRRELETLHWSPPDHEPPDTGPALGAMTELLTEDDVPYEVAAAAGDVIYRVFG